MVGTIAMFEVTDPSMAFSVAPSGRVCPCGHKVRNPSGPGTVRPSRSAHRPEPPGRTRTRWRTTSRYIERLTGGDPAVTAGVHDPAGRHRRTATAPCGHRREIPVDVDHQIGGIAGEHVDRAVRSRRHDGRIRRDRPCESVQTRGYAASPAPSAKPSRTLTGHPAPRRSSANRPAPRREYYTHWTESGTCGSARRPLTGPQRPQTALRVSAIRHGVIG